MIDVARERLCRLIEALQDIPGQPHLSTVIRWSRQGVGGVKLETLLIGGRRFTSREAVTRFIERRNRRASVPEGR